MRVSHDLTQLNSNQLQFFAQFFFLFTSLVFFFCVLGGVSTRLGVVLHTLCDIVTSQSIFALERGEKSFDLALATKDFFNRLRNAPEKKLKRGNSVLPASAYFICNLSISA